jgi:hypothetical protein
MDNPTTTKPATPNESQDKRAEWITPAITDYDIDEATLAGPPTHAPNTDGTTLYS